VSTAQPVAQAAAAPETTPRQRDDPAKVRDAAQQFEAFFITQILRQVRESSQGPHHDPSNDTATSFAEEQLALSMARNGGLGLSDVIVAGLEKSR